MANNNSGGMTTLEAVAELVLAALSPQPSDQPYIEYEDCLEQVRMAYCHMVWMMEMAAMRSDGDRSSFQALLKRRRYDYIGGGEVDVSDITIVTLPRDAGLHQVTALDAQGKYLDSPFIATGTGMMHRRQRIDSMRKYFRLENQLVFPIGVPKCTQQIEVVYVGVPDTEGMQVPRDYGSMAYERAMVVLRPTREVPVDATHNQNQNS